MGASDAASIAIRSAQASDLGDIIALDAEVTGIEKTDYWYELFQRYGTGRTRHRLFLVAESGQAFCLDARTGEVAWKERLEGTYFSSVVAAAGKVFFTNLLQIGKGRHRLCRLSRDIQAKLPLLLDLAFDTFGTFRIWHLTSFLFCLPILRNRAS